MAKVAKQKVEWVQETGGGHSVDPQITKALKDHVEEIVAAYEDDGFSLNNIADNLNTAYEDVWTARSVRMPSDGSTRKIKPSIRASHIKKLLQNKGVIAKG